LKYFFVIHKLYPILDKVVLNMNSTITANGLALSNEQELNDWVETVRQALRDQSQQYPDSRSFAVVNVPPLPSCIVPSYPAAIESTDKECPICMESIDRKINCVITECGHKFHTKCLLTNVAHNGFGCPYCRTEMIDDIEESDEEEEDRRDTLNNFFIGDEDDEEFEHHSWRPEDDDDEEDSEDTYNAFLGMRIMFAMAEGEEDADDVTEETDESSEEFSDSDSEVSSASDDDESEEDDELQRRRRRHTIRTDLRITNDEAQLEENRLLDNALPNINYITTRITSEAYGSMSFEDITTALLRLTMWKEYPQYERMIGNRIGGRLDHNLWMTLNQIIEGYQAYDHDELVEERRNQVEQAADMGMD